MIQCRSLLIVLIQFSTQGTYLSLNKWLASVAYVPGTNDGGAKYFLQQRQYGF